MADSPILTPTVIAYLENFAPATLARIMLSFVPLYTMCSSKIRGCHKIASFGSGSSTHEAILALLYPEAEVNCYDVSAEYIPAATKVLFEKLPNFKFVPLDPEARLLKGLKKEFDFVLSVQTLEHIEQMEDALATIAACVSPGGYLYVDTPLFHEQPEREPNYEKMMARAWDLHKHYHLGFSRKRMEQRIVQYDFRVEARGYYAYFAGDGSILSFVRRLELGRDSRGAFIPALVNGLTEALSFGERAFRVRIDEIDDLPVTDRVCAAIRVLGKRLAT